MQQESNIYFHHHDMKNKVSDSSTMAHINKKKKQRIFMLESITACFYLMLVPHLPAAPWN